MKQALLLEGDDHYRSQLAAAVAEAFPGIGIEAYHTLDPAQLHTRHFDMAIINLDPCNNSALVLIKKLSTNGALCIATSHSCEAVITALQAGAQGYLLTTTAPDEISTLLANSRQAPPLSTAVMQRLVNHFQQGAVTGGADHPLTPRETEVLRLVATGINLAAVSQQLGISRHTCADYVKTIYHKLGISSRAEAALAATRLGLT